MRGTSKLLRTCRLNLDRNLRKAEAKAAKEAKYRKKQNMLGDVSKSQLVLCCKPLRFLPLQIMSMVNCAFNGIWTLATAFAVLYRHCSGV